MSAVAAPGQPSIQPSRLAHGSTLLPRLLCVERFSAPICVALLLMHPTPFTWPALVIGLLPALARLAIIRRPWRPTVFDLPLVLLVLGTLAGYAVALDDVNAEIRLAGLAGMVIAFAWVREHTTTPRAAVRAATICLLLLLVAAMVMVHIAQPFLRLDRVPPLGWLAKIMEPWELYRVLVADPGALQRFRWYASGAGALAAVGLAFTAGLALSERRGWRLIGLGAAGIVFAGLLVASDNRGSMVAAALTLGGLVVMWRPKLLLLALLLVFGILDLIALGVVQRGLNLRTIVERVQFWQYGLTLATETPWTGVGLGAKSVELTYRAAFQPTYPPFSHTHSIYVQSLLEQGILGLLGLLLLGLALFWAALQVGRLPDVHKRAAGFAAAGGALALFAAGLTEIIALTSIGGVLLAMMLGLLAGATSTVQPTSHQWWRGQAWLTGWKGLPGRVRPTRRQLAVSLSVLVVGGLLISGIWRPMLASPFLNLGTGALYSGTLERGVSRAEQATRLQTADYWLTFAVTVDPYGVAGWRNRALVAAALGRPADARVLADMARQQATPTDRDALFGVGRAYASFEDWEQTVGVWEQAGAGAQLHRLGLRLTQQRDGVNQEQGLRALHAAARLGAPGRVAQDAIVQALLRRGDSHDAAVNQLRPLLIGGEIEYQTRLEIARVWRLAGRLDAAEAALAQAADHGDDLQLGLEQGLLLLARGQPADAEPLLATAAGLRRDTLPLPDGDDPRYWLATAQAQQGRFEQAVSTARAGLADLPTDQSSLRVPYHQLLGDSLRALGRADEAIGIYQAGLRLAPGHPGLTEGLAQARRATGR